MTLPRLMIARLTLAIGGAMLLACGLIEGDRALERRAYYLDRAGSAAIVAREERGQAVRYVGLAADARDQKARGVPRPPGHPPNGRLSWDEDIAWASREAEQHDRIARENAELARKYEDAARRFWSADDPGAP